MAYCLASTDCAACGDRATAGQRFGGVARRSATVRRWARRSNPGSHAVGARGHAHPPLADALRRSARLEGIVGRAHLRRQPSGRPWPRRDPTLGEPVSARDRRRAVARGGLRRRAGIRHRLRRADPAAGRLPVGAAYVARSGVVDRGGLHRAGNCARCVPGYVHRATARRPITVNRKAVPQPYRANTHGDGHRAARATRPVYVPVKTTGSDQLLPWPAAATTFTRYATRCPGIGAVTRSHSRLVPSVLCGPIRTQAPPSIERSR